VSAVLRRHAVRLSVRVTAIALGAAAVTGCTTFSDNDAVARVGDVELSSDELAESLALPPTDVTADGDAAREAVTGWIRTELLNASELGQRYADGPEAAGVVCLDVAFAQDANEAEGIKARLDDGERWDDVVGPLAAALGFDSHPACQPYAPILESADPAVTDILSALRPDGSSAVIDSGGFVVVRLRELADVDVQELVTVVGSTDAAVVDDFIASIETADVYVDPRFGSYDTLNVAVVAVD
jgi:hypothetical protein